VPVYGNHSGPESVTAAIRAISSHKRPFDGVG
jgi:hypothetical protein